MTNVLSVTNVRACEPEKEPRAYFASHCVFFLFFFFNLTFKSYSVIATLGEETKVFDFLSRVKVVFFSVCIKFNYGFRYE